MTLPVNPADYIIFDMFPTSVTDAHGNLLGDKFRTILTDNHLYVMAEGEVGPVWAIEEPLEEFDGDLIAGYTVNTYKIKKEGHCGCGSTLRGVFPFLGVPYISQIDPSLRKG